MFLLLTNIEDLPSEDFDKVSEFGSLTLYFRIFYLNNHEKCRLRLLYLWNFMFPLVQDLKTNL